MTDKKKKTGLELLREPFPANMIGKLPKPTKRQTDDVKADFKAGIRCKICGQWHHPKVAHLDYVGHAALTDRLLMCDPEWNWAPVAAVEDGTPKFDAIGGMWIRLTVCNVTRLGYGFPDGKTGGNAIKEVIGDAMRNAAMRFGAALDLWHKGELHVDDNEDDGGNNAAGNPPKKPPPPPPPRKDDGGNKAASSPPPREETPAYDEEAIAFVIVQLRAIWDLIELKAYWKALAELQPGIQSAPGVAEAKGAQKAAIEAKQEKPGD